MTQRTLPLDLHETRLARIERIAALLQADSRIERASTYFTEDNHRKAEVIAQRETARLTRSNRQEAPIVQFGPERDSGAARGLLDDIT